MFYLSMLCVFLFSQFAVSIAASSSNRSQENYTLYDIIEVDPHQLHDNTEVNPHHLHDIIEVNIHNLHNITEVDPHHLHDITEVDPRQLHDITEVDPHHLEITEVDPHHLHDNTEVNPHHLHDIIEVNIHNLHNITEVDPHYIHDVMEGNTHYLDEITESTEPNSTREDQHFNTHNATAPLIGPQLRIFLDKTATVLMIFVTFTLLLAMGAATPWREVWDHSKNPSRPLIGMAGQFVLLPALSVCISLAFSLKPLEALGVLMVSCSPGGSSSNFYTYWLDGDLALSIVMTTWSAAVSVGTMPLNIWIYSRIWIDNESDVVIPYKTIMIGLLFILIPSAIGLIIRAYKEKVANCITKVCSVVSWLGIIVTTTIWMMLYWEVFVTATPSLWLAAFLLPATGFGLAYGFSLLVKQSQVVARTIGIETGCQNLAVALNIILISFPDPEIKSQMILYPTIFGVMSGCETIVFIGIYHLYKHCREHHRITITRDDDTKKVNIKTTLGK